MIRNVGHIDMPILQLNDISIEVVYKKIKNIHLSVYPPSGQVRISAPMRMDIDTIRVFVISKLGWIRKKQEKLREQERETVREYIDRESHYYLGRRYLLKTVTHSGPSNIVLKYDLMVLYVRGNMSSEQKQSILEAWYRRRLKEIVQDCIDKWEKIIKVKVEEFRIKKMKTKWGTCNRSAGRIWLNLDLIKKSLHCIEYIIVHEMVHLVEKNHNEIFIAHMDRYLPKWRFYKEDLNKSLLKYENWGTNAIQNITSRTE